MRIIIFTAALSIGAAALAQDTAPRPMMSAACREEVMKLCPPGGDRDARRQCMMASRDKISDGCKKEMAEMRAARQASRKEHDQLSGGAQHGDPMTAPPPENATQPF